MGEHRGGSSRNRARTPCTSSTRKPARGGAARRGAPRRKREGRHGVRARWTLASEGRRHAPRASRLARARRGLTVAGQSRIHTGFPRGASEEAGAGWKVSGGVSTSPYHRAGMVPPLRLTRAELTLLDRLASEAYGLPSAVLMENAGRGAAEEVQKLLSVGAASGEPARVFVLAGSGNNGGDACLVARHLAIAGVDVELFATSRLEDLRGDAAKMRRAAEKIGIVVHDASAEAALAKLAGSRIFV